MFRGSRIQEGGEIGSVRRMVKPVIVPIEPRIFTTARLCFYLGRSESWFAEHRVKMEAAGFPMPDPIIGGWDRRAVDHWLDERSGMASTSNGAMPAAPSWDRPKSRSA